MAAIDDETAGGDLNNLTQVLILGTADWNQPIATNQHYIAAALSVSFSVTFVESIGLRRPSMSVHDLHRIVRRLRPGGVSMEGRQIPDAVEVISPRIIPLHSRLTRLPNQILLHSVVRGWLKSELPKLLWCYSPLSYGLERFADGTVYHCVDLLGEVPGIDARMIRDAEATLAHSGAIAIGSSPAVARHLKEVGFPNPILWPNVAETSVFARGHAEVVRGRAAVFAGNLTESKVDFGLLARVVATGRELHIAGPIAEGGGAVRAWVGALVAAGAIYHGLLSLDELAQLYSQCAVGLIPYVRNRYTEGVSPLKTFEYLAAGLSVVSIGVPDMASYPGDVFVAQDQDEFIDLVGMQTTPTEVDRARRLRIAQSNSWERRAEAARTLVRSIGGQ